MPYSPNRMPYKGLRANYTRFHNLPEFIRKVHWDIMSCAISLFVATFRREVLHQSSGSL
jgi:hypothetical protein